MATPATQAAQSFYQVNYDGDFVNSQIYVNDAQGMRRYIENAPGTTSLSFDGTGLNYYTDRGILSFGFAPKADYTFENRTLTPSGASMQATYGTQYVTSQLLRDDLMKDDHNFLNIYEKALSEIATQSNKMFVFNMLGLGNGKVMDVVIGVEFNTGNSWTADITVAAAHLVNVGDSYDIIDGDTGALKVNGAGAVVTAVKAASIGAGVITLNFPLLSSSDTITLDGSDDLHIQNSVATGTGFFFQGMERAIDNTIYPHVYTGTNNIGLSRTGADTRLAGTKIDANGPMTNALLTRAMFNLQGRYQAATPVFGANGDGLEQIANEVSIIMRFSDLQNLRTEARTGQKEYAWGLGETTDYGLPRVTYQGIPIMVYDALPYNIVYFVDWTKVGFNYKEKLNPVKPGEMGPFYMLERAAIARTDYVEKYQMLFMDPKTSCKITNVTETLPS